MDQASSRSTRWLRSQKVIWQTNLAFAAFLQRRYVACHFRNRNCESPLHMSAASSFSAVSPVPSGYPIFQTALTQKGRWAVSVSALLFSRPYHIRRRIDTTLGARQVRKERELNIYRRKHPGATRRCTVHTRYSGTKSARRARLEISRSLVVGTLEAVRDGEPRELAASHEWRCHTDRNQLTQS